MKFGERAVRASLVGPLTGVAVAILFTYLAPGLIDRIEYITYYARCQWHLGDLSPAERDSLRAQEPDVCVVDIDGRSLERLGNYWGWNRGYHARMLSALGKYFPAAVGFDVMFDNPEDRRYMDRFDAILERASVRKNLSEELRRHILSSVDYDTRLIEATREAGVVYHAVRMGQKSDYAEYAQSQIAYRTTKDWHLSMNPASALSIPIDSTAGTIERKSILDGCFPALAHAAAGLGHVNMPPNTDGVVREIPLLYRFDSTDAVYLPLSVRICADLFGTPNSEIRFRSGEYLDIGTPFKIWRTAEGELRCSFPRMRVEQVHAILDHADQILHCPPGHSIDISTFVAAVTDSMGTVALATYGDPIPAPVLGALSGLDAAQVRALGDGGEMKIGDSVSIVKESEGSYALSAPFGAGQWYLSDPDLATLPAAARDAATRATPGKRTLLSYPFTVRHQSGELVSTIPVLRGRTLRDLCDTPWKRIEALKAGERLEFGQRVRIPLTHGNRHIITYFGPAKNTFQRLSFSSVMADKVSGGLSGKIFLVGSTAPGLFDLVHAPLGENYPGVEVHASLIRSFLTNTFVRRLPSWGDLVVLILVGVITGTIVFLMPPLPGALAVVALLGLYMALAVRLLGTHHLWLEMARPVLTAIVAYACVVAYRYMTEQRDRKFLHSTFKAYLSPEIIDAMYRKKRFPKLGGEERVLTAFFTDIQSFSTFSEKLGSPTRLVELLNEYLTAMTDILLQHGGTLDKYEGDAILAFFGAPMPMEDHAFQACTTALSMQRALGDLREKWRAEGEKWPDTVHGMRMRIGINTGPITTGNMGSAVRMNYTMMGDAVNLAARLESAAKRYGVYTMISDFTLSLVGGAFETRQLDKIQVVGKLHPVVVYEIMGEKGKLPPEYAALVGPYRRGLELYESRRWDEAEALFAEAEKIEPLRTVAPEGMSPSTRLLEYCRHLRANPPGPDWNGVTQLTSK